MGNDDKLGLLLLNQSRNRVHTLTDNSRALGGLIFFALSTGLSASPQPLLLGLLALRSVLVQQLEQLSCYTRNEKLTKLHLNLYKIMKKKMPHVSWFLDHLFGKAQWKSQQEKDIQYIIANPMAHTLQVQPRSIVLMSTSWLRELSTRPETGLVKHIIAILNEESLVQLTVAVTCLAVQGLSKLVDGRRHLQTLDKNSTLALKTNVLGPPDEAAQIPFRLDVLACTKIRRSSNACRPCCQRGIRILPMP